MAKTSTTTAIATAVFLAASTLGCSERDTLVAERSANPDSSQADITTTPVASAPAATPTTTTATTTTVPTLRRPTLSATPEELAASVVAAETVARDPESPAHMAEAAAFEAQVLYRQLARRPGWRARVLAAVEPRWHVTINANADARLEFRALTGSRLAQNVPAWRIVDPLPMEELLGYYEAGEAEFGVPWEVLAAVHLVETGIGRIQGVSSAGAQGPMQFIPSTWEAYGDGGDITDHADAIRGAARYLAANGGGSGDLDNALFRYNNSDRYVRGVQLYASVITDDPAAYRAFYHWQIIYLSEAGELWLPTGDERAESVPVADYVADHPDRVLTTSTN